MAENQNNSSKLNKLNGLIYLAIFMLIVVVGFYFYNFNNGFSIDRNHWGMFGDFVGGTLNPIFAFFSLMAIIYTIKIQTQELEYSRAELEETRKELKESRIAQQGQSKSLELQNQATKCQMFENTFFQLIKLFLEIRTSLFISMDITDDEKILVSGFDPSDAIKETIKNSGARREEGCTVISAYLIICKSKYKNYESFNRKYEKFTSSYFGQIYQVLKFVDDSNIKEKQRYIDIFRTLFTKDELEFLFYHCLGRTGRRKFKKLIEKYEFFEHITQIRKKEELLKYKISAYGKNEILREIHIDYKNKEKDKYWNQNFDE